MVRNDSELKKKKIEEFCGKKSGRDSLYLYFQEYKYIFVERDSYAGLALWRLHEVIIYRHYEKNFA